VVCLVLLILIILRILDENTNCEVFPYAVFAINLTRHVETFCTFLTRFTEAVFYVSKCSWNEWVTLPVMFSDLPRNAQLALTIYDAVGPSKIQPVGGTTISLFGKHGVFRQVLYCFIFSK
jgi:hypothetical protein